MKPKGRKYRNLTMRGGVIYYERLARGRRIKISTKTADWNVAAQFRDLYEERKGIGRTPFFSGELPRFDTFAGRYLAEETAHLAPTTRRDRASYLRPDGPLVGFFGPRRLDDIDPPLVREWWSAEIAGPGRSIKTGRCYLDILAAVLGFAMDLALIESNPVTPFRETLRRWSRTQRGRAESDPTRNIRPIERPEDIERLLDAARHEGPSAHVFVLLLLDAGLRVGEALGLRWSAVAWGCDPDDVRRALVISRSRPRGGPEGLTKSGRARRVALSRRLEAALHSLYCAQGAPGPDALVLAGIDPDNFRHRDWSRILDRAGIGQRAPKDLRDTFASQLLTAGVQLGWVSRQLGHADVAVTARHYARWAGGDAYRPAMLLGPGEVPADLLARLAESHQSPTTSEEAGSPSWVTPGLDSEIWRAQHDSNMRPSGPQKAWRHHTAPFLARNRLMPQGNRGREVLPRLADVIRGQGPAPYLALPRRRVWERRSGSSSRTRASTSAAGAPPTGGR